jgi:hypothetical protein
MARNVNDPLPWPPANRPINSAEDWVSPPTNSVLPAITGTTTVGQVLTCSQGTWANSPTSYSYQWKRDGTTNVGTNSSSYTLVAADQTHKLACTVTATNAGGSASATSAQTATIA